MHVRMHTAHRLPYRPGALLYQVSPRAVIFRGLLCGSGGVNSAETLLAIHLTEAGFAFEREVRFDHGCCGHPERDHLSPSCRRCARDQDAPNAVLLRG